MTAVTTVSPMPDFGYVFGDVADIQMLIQGDQFSTKSLFALPTEPEGLLQAFATQSGLFTWIGVLMVAAEADMASAKEMLEATVAELDQMIRQECADEGEKVTEKVIESRIKLDSNYGDASEIYLAARHKYNVLKVLYEAIRQRGELLRSVSAFLRTEQEQPYFNN